MSFLGTKLPLRASIISRPTELPMYKYIALMISMIPVISFAASMDTDVPDFCKSGRYTCQKLNANYVVAYPNNQTNDSTSEQISNGEKDMIDVDLNNLTWSAYDNHGELIKSGHVSGGKDYCADIDSECRTVTGTFDIYSKGDENCKSRIFPVGRGGAPMPYCMFFHEGYALHGANFVPDYNASHGCVRMSPEDAQWLNEDFVQIGLTRVNIHY